MSTNTFGQWDAHIEMGKRRPVQPPQTLWTPITGESSLPTDDEALCLFVEWKDGILKERWVITAGQAKEEWPIVGYTHYTILTKPVK